MLLELDARLETAPLAMAQAYLENSSFDQASKTLQDSMEPTEDEARLALLGSVYGLSHQPERARKILEQLLKMNRLQDVSGFYIAQVCLSLGDNAQALSWLERAADERSPLIAYINVSPRFERLRAEPRFRALLNRIGLER